MIQPTPLQAELGKRNPFDLPEQEAYLNLTRTASLLTVEFERFFRDHGLSQATFNALRILRGATLGDRAPGRRTCTEIGELMVTPVPDVTRVVDRIEQQGLAERCRCDEDRRVVYVKITRKGLDLLASLDGPLLEMHRRQLGHLSERELQHLSELLAKARRQAAETTDSDAR
jgi:DNA-binding MarR family transcriptional regulator